MGLQCIVLYISFIIMHSIILSNSKSIVKNLPGFDGDLPFTFETGYVGVGEHGDVEFFYYFVESQRNPSQDPLILYLTGGPGVAALSTFLYQIGPLSFNIENCWNNNITLELNPYSWTKIANMIFIDTPAGVGFSYSKTWEASRSSDSILASNVYDFLRKWLMEHPRFLSNPLYLSGISYMGLIVPRVVLETYNGNKVGNQPRVNIEGYIMISPFTDKFADFNSRLELAHRLALISDDIYKSAIESCHGNYVYADDSNALCSNSLQRMEQCIGDINLSNTLEPFCAIVNPDPSCPEATQIFSEVWANNKDVQKALNVREGTVERWAYTNMSVRYFFDKEDTTCYSFDIFSSIEWQKQLTTETCEVFIISGDHDMVFPYVGIQKWIKSLDVPIASPWKPWFLRSQVGGYQTTYERNGYSLKHATIKGAGHVVFQTKPEEALSMVSEWLGSHTYSSA
ncbi:peptidase S10, serine carboxypeptidase, Alpha/Beta hydrolase fold protein [Artemisia annua]|uniref:Peptidase S10, serine carboxypeptidase, Alpha/Beta hydrolase fold protein n=1 Tax=Artemisia annua TaxID=35608 RepID=A0A2U1KHM5_ARTAN|nr:peptidase S10, serine carboxypeptidase, Alpha/Beta hydrolase fold protein [Artemisia annua]